MIKLLISPINVTLVFLFKISFILICIYNNYNRYFSVKIIRVNYYFTYNKIDKFNYQNETKKNTKSLYLFRILTENLFIFNDSYIILQITSLFVIA